jgi:Cytidylate kinase-like family
MPGGVHVRLVAPLGFRITATAKSRGIPAAEAAVWVRERDANREAFYRRHWPSHPLNAEDFTATFNSAAIARERLVECLLPLIGVREKRGCSSGDACEQSRQKRGQATGAIAG